MVTGLEIHSILFLGVDTEWIPQQLDGVHSPRPVNACLGRGQTAPASGAGANADQVELMILYDDDDDNGPSPFNLHPCHPDDLIRFTFPYISALFFFFRRGMVLFDRHRLKSNRLVRLLMPDNLLGALRLAWVILVIWGEIGVFLYTLSDCRWPTPAHNTVRRRRCSLIP